MPIYKMSREEARCGGFFQALKRQVPSFSVKFHPSVQNRSALQLIYHMGSGEGTWLLPVIPRDGKSGTACIKGRCGRFWHGRKRVCFHLIDIILRAICYRLVSIEMAGDVHLAEIGEQFDGVCGWSFDNAFR